MAQCWHNFLAKVTVYNKILKDIYKVHVDFLDVTI